MAGELPQATHTYNKMACGLGSLDWCSQDTLLLLKAVCHMLLPGLSCYQGPAWKPQHWSLQPLVALLLQQVQSGVIARPEVIQRADAGREAPELLLSGLIVAQARRAVRRLCGGTASAQYTNPLGRLAETTAESLSAKPAC